MEAKKTAKLNGNNAAMVFGPVFTLKMDESDPDPAKVDLSKINLKWDLYGATTGPMAGFVMVVDRNRTTPIRLPAKIVTRLEGVVYSPKAVLEVYGMPGDGGAEDSAWTVLVGRQIKLTLDAVVNLNTDYSGSNVPVPKGVGNKAGPTGQRLAG